jgi:hypothetical protein
MFFRFTASTKIEGSLACLLVHLEACSAERGKNPSFRPSNPDAATLYTRFVAKNLSLKGSSLTYIDFIVRTLLKYVWSSKQLLHDLVMNILRNSRSWTSA